MIPSRVIVTISPGWISRRNCAPIAVSAQLSEAMDFWASLEHKMRYKKSIPAEQMKYLQDELYDCAEQSAALDKRMQSIRNLIAENKEEEEEPKGFFLPLL